MAFRLRREESVARGLRRLATKELRSAHDELRRRTPPTDEAIHEARKSLKKVRAIGELIEAGGGRGLAKYQKRLRRINRRLSGLRDADAMIAILAKLKRRNPRLFDEHTFARLRHRLLLHKQASRKRADEEGAWKHVLRETRRLGKDARRWDPAHRRFRALAAGIRQAHRRGRKSLRRAQKRQDAAHFHDWRKQIKTLWYDVRLLEDSSTAIRRDVLALRHAERWLGDDHNLVVLCVELSKDSSSCDLERLRHAAARYQCRLRQEAVAATRGIYSRTPRDYERRARNAWNKWNRRASAGRSRRVAGAAA